MTRFFRLSFYPVCFRAGCLALILLSTGCHPIRPDIDNDVDTASILESPWTAPDRKFTPSEEVERLSREVPIEYVIGEGDTIRVQVWHRPEASVDQVIVAPDGVISLPRLGEVQVANKTRKQAAEAITEALTSFYADPEVTVTVTTYNNNKAYILGRVGSPGIHRFPGPATLVEAITRAGGIPGISDNEYPTELSILRGNSQMIWIDVNELLLNGNMALNARIQNGDTIFVPAADQRIVYLLGEVGRPGSMALSAGLTLLDAVMSAGGPTEDANLKHAYLIRWENGQSIVKEIDLAHTLSTGDLTDDYLLKDKDVILLQSKGIARLNYYLRQLSPGLRFIDSSDSSYNRFIK